MKLLTKELSTSTVTSFLLGADVLDTLPVRTLKLHSVQRVRDYILCSY
jgi:hypothetical protein